MVEFVITDTGRVKEAKTKKSTLNHQNVENCLLDLVRKTEFPSAPHGQVAVVDYPFVFESAKKAEPGQK